MSQLVLGIEVHESKAQSSHACACTCTCMYMYIHVHTCIYVAILISTMSVFLASIVEVYMYCSYRRLIKLSQ